MSSDPLTLSVAGLLGIVEGLTEYIPVSSTGHLILFGHLFGFEGEKAATFEIFIQLGAILAVLLLYWPRFRGLLEIRRHRRFFGEGLLGVPGLLKMAVACAPACVLGLVARKPIKAHLFTPGTVAAALIVGGIIMWLVESRKSQPKVLTISDLSLKNAFYVGVFQCFALWPGMSRSGSMIAGGLLLGFERRVAAEFSFLVAVPMMTLASVYDLLKSRELLSTADVLPFSVGFVVSFLTAVVAVRVFIAALGRYTLKPFAVYRVIIGLLVLWTLPTGL